MAQVTKGQSILGKADGGDFNSKSGDARSQVILFADPEAGVFGVDIELINVVPVGNVAGHCSQTIAAHCGLAAVSVNHPHLGLGPLSKRFIDHQYPVGTVQ